MIEGEIETFRMEKEAFAEMCTSSLPHGKKKSPKRNKTSIKAEQWLAVFDAIAASIEDLSGTGHSVLEAVVLIGPSATNPKEVYSLSFAADAMDETESMHLHDHQLEESSVATRLVTQLKRNFIKHLVVDAVMSGSPHSNQPSSTFLALHVCPSSGVSASSRSPPSRIFLGNFVPKHFTLNPRRKLRHPYVCVSVVEESTQEAKSMDPMEGADNLLQDAGIDGNENMSVDTADPQWYLLRKPIKYLKD
jgi:hypothetical protein